MKRQPTEWENKFATDYDQQGVISKIYKQLIQLSIKKSLIKNEEGSDQDGRVVGHEAHLLPKYIKSTSTCGMILTEYLLNAGRRPQASERGRKSPHNQVGQKKKEKNKERNWDETGAPGREQRKRKGPRTLGSTLSSGEISQDRQCNTWFVAARMERDLHRGSMPLPCAPQPETHICPCGWGLDAEAQALEIRTARQLGLAAWQQPERAGDWCDCN